MCPDDAIVTDNSRVDRWGAAWNRYHALEIQYFMSSLSSRISSTISQNFLWKNAVSTTPVLDREYRDRFPERIQAATEKIESSERGDNVAPVYSKFPLTTVSAGVATTTTSSTSTATEESNRIDSLLDKVSKAVCDISVEQCQGSISQSAKKVLFG